MSAETGQKGTKIRLEITVPPDQDPNGVVSQIFGGANPEGMSGGRSGAQLESDEVFKAIMQGAQRSPRSDMLPSEAFRAAMLHPQSGQARLYDYNPYGLPPTTITRESLGYKLKKSFRNRPVASGIAVFTAVAVVAGAGAYAYTKGVLGTASPAAAVAEYKPVNLKTMLSAGTLANGKPFAIAGVGAKGTETVNYVNKAGKIVPIEPIGDEELSFDYRQGIPLIVESTDEKGLFTISEEEGKTKVVVDLGKLTVGTQVEQYENNQQEPDGTVDGFTANRLFAPPVSESKAFNSDEAKQVNALVTYPSDDLKLQLENIGMFKDASGNELKTADMTNEQLAAVSYELALLAQLQYNALGQIQDQKCDGFGGLQASVESFVANAVAETVRQNGGDPSTVEVSVKGNPKLEGLVEREAANKQKGLDTVAQVVNVRMQPADGTDYKCVITGVK